MLLGCCHCEGDVPSSSSSPSSGSSGSSFVGSTNTNNCATENCISKVFARRYSIIFGYNEPLSCGPHYSVGSYEVEFFSGSGPCAWRSTISGKKRSTCVDATGPMFSLGMYHVFGTTPTPGGPSVRYILGVFAEDTGPATRMIYYGSNLTNVPLSAGAPYAPIDCLHSFTLPITSNSTAQNNFRLAVAGVTTGALLPTTVTITPAP